MLAVFALEGVGAILGGMFLVIAPDGYFMKMPVDVLHGVFPNFLIPGLALTGIGIVSIAAFFVVLQRNRIDWIIAGTALVGFVIWFVVEIVVLREILWLHIVWGAPVLVGIWAAFSLVPFQKIKKQV